MYQGGRNTSDELPYNGMITRARSKKLVEQQNLSNPPAKKKVQTFKAERRKNYNIEKFKKNEEKKVRFEDEDKTDQQKTTIAKVNDQIIIIKDQSICKSIGCLNARAPKVCCPKREMLINGSCNCPKPEFCEMHYNNPNLIVEPSILTFR